MLADISGLNAAPCINLILITAVNLGCVLTLVVSCKNYDSWKKK